MTDFFIGSKIEPTGAAFRVWAPFTDQVHVVFTKDGSRAALTKEDRGYHSLHGLDVAPGCRYMYSLDNGPPRPDPASRFQPEGVHGSSALVDPHFHWTDVSWTPPELKDSVIYELHTGTFTAEGTFEAILHHLDYLQDLGITTIQLMPVAQFPGARNWGYDGVQLFAPHSSYGGPTGLKKLINACHSRGIAVFLDVVYNHLGPEGNYLGEFGPYFTSRYESPWGSSINLDGPYSDEVRHFLIQNAIYWLDTYHFDGLRLDATHALFDFSARPFLAELSTAIDHWARDNNRKVTLIAENDQSDRRLTLSTDEQGFGMDGQWLDDLHHTLHVALTQENEGYYIDYQSPELLTKVLSDGFAYTGEYSPARKRTHGTPVADLSTDRFVVSTQTHDQVGNRLMGDRLSQLTNLDGLKLAACLLACSPYTPMLFMGEEYGETAPFMYFISHSDPQLIEAVRQGRAKEFADFGWPEDPPDPQSESTFLSCKLDHSLRGTGDHLLLFSFYKTLLALRRSSEALTQPSRSSITVETGQTPHMVCLERRSTGEVIRVLMNFDTQNAAPFFFKSNEFSWENILDSSAPEWSQTPRRSLPRIPDFIASDTTQEITLAPAGFVIYKATKQS